MREIKFRAWDGKHIRSGDDYFISLGGQIFDIDDCTYFLEGVSGITIMQYTGLKDRNGVEIYEGDIVSFDDSDGGYEYQDLVINTGIVAYGELGFYFTNRVAVEMDDFYIKDGRCDDVEVIGNIHDNPELMGDIARVKNDQT